MRCFSIVSSPHDQALMFAIRIQGLFTEALSHLEVGDKISVMGPFGDFTIRAATGRGNLLFAGGIGITPFISMIRDASKTQSPAPLTLLYSCRSQDNVPFLAELLEQEKINRNFKVYFFITDGPVDKLIGATVFKSKINDEWIKQATGGNYQSYNYYLCGPKGLTVAVKKILENDGVAESLIFSESFSQVSKVRLNDNTSAQSLVYKMMAWSIILTLFAVGVTDLKQAIPKMIAVETQSSSQPSAPLATTPATDNNSNAVATPQSTAAGSYTSPSTTQTPTSTYQAPVYQAPIYQTPKTAVS